MSPLRRARSRDVRCDDCGILLATVDTTGLTIRRNELEAHYGGPGLVSIRCYRTSCRHMNVVHIPTTPAGGSPTA